MPKQLRRREEEEDQEGDNPEEEEENADEDEEDEEVRKHLDTQMAEQSKQLCDHYNMYSRVQLAGRSAGRSWQEEQETAAECFYRRRSRGGLR